MWPVDIPTCWIFSNLRLFKHTNFCDYSLFALLFMYLSIVLTLINGRKTFSWCSRAVAKVQVGCWGSGRDPPRRRKRRTPPPSPRMRQCWWGGPPPPPTAGGSARESRVTPIVSPLLCDIVNLNLGRMYDDERGVALMLAGTVIERSHTPHHTHKWIRPIFIQKV